MADTNDQTAQLDGEHDALAEKLNRRHAVVNYAGKTLVLTEGPEGRTEFGRIEDLHVFYANSKVPNATGTRSVPISKIWVEHPLRRTYPNGVVFSPSETPTGAYNLWKGFSVEPKEGDCSKFLWHCEHVICSGEPERWRYLQGWMAHMIQHPGEKPGVAVVLKGLKGVGKDTFAAVLGKLFPSHYVRVSQTGHITGRFNAPHAYALLLHGEEAFWSGDPSAVGPLNSLITSDIALIERKGQDPIQMTSCLRLVLSSNDDAVVPATSGERRYAVYEVADTKKGDSAYFAGIHHQIEKEEGLAALLYHLRNYDLGDFDVRQIPRTEGLARQQIEGLRGADKWWFEVLLSGELQQPIAKVGDNPSWSKDETYSVLCADLYRQYEEWHSKHKFQGRLQSTTALGHFLLQKCSGRQRVTHRLDPKRTAPKYVFPVLSKCRGDFSRVMDLPINWAEWSLESELGFEDDSGLV